MTNRITHMLATILRGGAPSLAAALRRRVIRRREARALAGAFKRHGPALAEAQRRFDAAHPVDRTALEHLAATSSLIAVTTAPFAAMSLLVERLAEETIVLGELVVVDATAETTRGAAIHDFAAAWRLRLPLTRLTIVPYSRQDFRLTDAIQEGFAASQHPNVWIAGHAYLPLPRSIEYLVKAFIAEGGKAVAVTRTLSPEGHLVADDTNDPAPANAVQDLAALPLIEETASFRRGIFGGGRNLLMARGEAALLDPLFVDATAIADLALRLHDSGIKLVYSAASLAYELRPPPNEIAAPWETMHDRRWLLAKRRGGVAADDGRIELVCPFHRGDLMLAIEVAAHAISVGKRVRLHTAESLVPWVRDMDPNLDVEPIPIKVASAQETYPRLLDSYHYVAQRDDASPRLTRCHPARTLSDTDNNLLGYMLTEIGLPSDTRLINLKPAIGAEQRATAQRLMAPFGDKSVFVHPLGGWKLKSIPPQPWQVLVEQLRLAGFKAVQIGGASDERFYGTDGAILQDFLPSQWRAILARGSALIGVDSWTAHFASILDIPQVTLYGSTHPRHVNTKAWFAEQTSPALILGPVVNCSPCNSLSCLRFPDRDYCTGYAIDTEALQTFLASLSGGGSGSCGVTIPARV